MISSFPQIDSPNATGTYYMVPVCNTVLLLGLLHQMKAIHSMRTRYSIKVTPHSSEFQFNSVQKNTLLISAQFLCTIWQP